MIIHSIFKINKMDCPSEEQLIKMRLEGLYDALEFDIPGRKLEVWHTVGAGEILSSLDTLNLETTLLLSGESKKTPQKHIIQKKLLWAVLWINFVFFAVEILTGYFSRSMGLVADSLDMLADASVYALAIFAIGGSKILKNKIAAAAGLFQIILAVGGVAEVIRRFISPLETPDFQFMVTVSLLALAGNVASLIILQKEKSGEAHIQASLIFTSNDIIANIGVIFAGILVYTTNSSIPDLVVGTLVFLLVLQGAYRILRLSRQ